jgi:hypothetical protein
MALPFSPGLNHLARKIMNKASARIPISSDNVLYLVGPNSRKISTASEAYGTSSHTMLTTPSELVL